MLICYAKPPQKLMVINAIIKTRKWGVLELVKNLDGSQYNLFSWKKGKKTWQKMKENIAKKPVIFTKFS